MCRIAGIIDPKSNSLAISENVKRMCDVMAHGGPDDEGFYQPTTNTTFGHRRLALIDLSPAGHQPMLRQNLSISFNGEIYNYLELKQELKELGLTFTTQTDTEVILAGFEAWGINIFKKLEGMFAFALHNTAENATYLVRDQSGIKTLYFTTQSDKLIFASEVKAFKQTDYKLEENRDWRVYFLAFGHIPHPYTTLKNVFSLTPGSFLKWNHETTSFKINSFKTAKLEKTITESAEVSKALKIQLENAVKSHLISDAPIGVFLSGGIDSSIITLLANKVVGENLNSLSINFVEEQFSEEKYQKLICEKTAGKHNSYRVTDEDFEANFDSVLASMDQPTNDGINSWFVNKCAKENGLKAVLSGIGADELYGGYPSFKRMDLVKKLQLLPKSVLKLAKFVPSEKLSRFYYLSYKNPIGEYLFLRGFFIPSTIAKILGRPQKEVDNLLENVPFDNEANDLEGEERASWLETNLFMQNQLLKDTDVMSMAHGIEVRVPFLAQDFLNTTKSINNAERFTKRPKGALIKAFANILPEEIWNRPKMGFTFPLQQWFLKHGKITDESLYSNSESLRLIRSFKKGKLHWSKAYALYQVRS
ncbi:MAG: asparagine synthase (glutamine-hydrolyzing) [Pedobacter sp.]|nr:MAG: asparagine synthase (glutamine-hydrolyzing) [Pedobacter sp.]